MENILNSKLRKSSKPTMKIALDRTMANPSSQNLNNNRRTEATETEVQAVCDDDDKTIVLQTDDNAPSLKLSRSLTDRLKSIRRGHLFLSNASSAVTTPKDEISEEDLLDPDNRAWV